MTTLEIPTVTVLASGVALGVYVPALLLSKQLQHNNISTEVCVLESYYQFEHLQSLLRHKKAFQQNFSLALTARKMPYDIRASLDMNAINSLLSNWQRENRRHFIVWSGFWLPILEEYVNRLALHTLKIDFCRIDAAITPSFKQYSGSSLQGRDIWFWQLSSGKLIYSLPVTERLTVPWQNRQDRYFLHGGGWGLGNYLSKVDELAQQGAALNMILRDSQEVIAPVSGNRYFRFNPNWLPWERKKSESYHFPALEEWVGSSFQAVSSDLNEHLLIPLIENCQAIISKPGGGTLMDAYGTATPLVMLDPYGESEVANAMLWKQLGFGITYEDWKQTGFSPAVLAQLHQNLLKQRDTINYPQRYGVELLGTVTELPSLLGVGI